MSGAGVIADGHLVGVITADPVRYAGRLVAVPVSWLLAEEGFRTRLAEHGVRAEAAPVGAGWYLRLPGGLSVSLAPAYRPVSRRFRPALPTLLRPEHGLVPFLGDDRDTCETGHGLILMCSAAGADQVSPRGAMGLGKRAGL
jgi:hypothetical protein